MELSKVCDGFTLADTLVIKAQVQVIRWVDRLKYLGRTFAYWEDGGASGRIPVAHSGA